MKRFLLTTAALAVLTAPAAAFNLGSVPIAFQGLWVIAEQGKPSGTMAVTAKTVDFGGGFKSTITKVEPANEDGDEIDVTWHTETNNVTTSWKLAKVNGMQLLLQAGDPQSPAGMTIWRRVGGAR